MSARFETVAGGVRPRVEVEELPHPLPPSCSAGVIVWRRDEGDELRELVGAVKLGYDGLCTRTRFSLSVVKGLARSANLPPLEEGPEHHRASETLAKLVPAPYCPRRWCWCQTAPYTRRRESWLLTKYSFSLVREPAAAQLPTHGLGLLSCLPPALTLAESDTVAKPTALS